MLLTIEKISNLWYSLALDDSTDHSRASQLLVFIRGVSEDIQITEDLAIVSSIHGTTTENYIFIEVLITLQNCILQWGQFRSVSVDGGKNRAGVIKGGLGQIGSQLESCIRKHTLEKNLNVSCVLKPVVSAVYFIRVNALNQHRFQEFLVEF